MPEEKKTHPVAINIPIDVWDKIEMQRLKEKQKLVDRKLTITEHLINLLNKGLNG